MGKNLANLLSKQLDRRLPAERNEQFVPPRSGWIQAIRKSLGLTTTQLATRLQISKQAMAKLEKSEQQGTINLSTLKKEAETLDCDVKVTLIPRKPLGQMIHEQAQKKALELVKKTELLMRLEDQG